MDICQLNSTSALIEQECTGFHIDSFTCTFTTENGQSIYLIAKEFDLLYLHVYMTNELRRPGFHSLPPFTLYIDDVSVIIAASVSKETAFLRYVFSPALNGSVIALSGNSNKLFFTVSSFAGIHPFRNEFSPAVLKQFYNFQTHRLQITSSAFSQLSRRPAQ